MKAILLSVLLLSLPVFNPVIANSYAMAKMEKKHLPEKVNQFRAWREARLSHSLTAKDIDTFLKFGKIGFDSRDNLFNGRFPIDEHRQDAHFYWSRLHGVFTDEEGKIFRWRLKTPQILSIEGVVEEEPGFGMTGHCTLELNKNQSVSLTRFPEPAKWNQPLSPDIGSKNLKITSGFLPATGGFELLKREDLNKFLRHGKPLNLFPDELWDYSGDPQVDGIFPDRRGNYWYANLHSGYLLELDNGIGDRITLGLPDEPKLQRYFERDFSDSKFRMAKPGTLQCSPGVTDEDLANAVDSMGKTGGMIDFKDSKISDAGLVHIAKFTGAFGINLSGTPVTGEGFHHLKKIKGLRFIFLDRSDVTDENLLKLVEIPSLVSISCNDTRVTEAGVAAATAAAKNPKLKIRAWFRK